MATLATINGEALAVDGLTFWGKRTALGPERRIALICSDQRGAVEVWTFERWMTSDNPIYRGLGGVEVHARAALHDFMSEMPDCEIVGGTCWTDGSSLAYSEHFLPLIDAGDHAGVLRKLAAWHRAQFVPGGGS